MAKLIGTNPNQVPTNADLGTMAYQDAERPSLGQTLVKSSGTALIVERTGDAPNLQLKGNGQNLGHIYAFQNGLGGDIAFYPTNSSGVITQRMKIHSDGYVTMPYQPAFMAMKTTTQSNIQPTTTHTITFDNEVFDNNGDYNGNATFTAPITGKYQFNVNIRVATPDAGAGYYHTHVRTSNHIYGFNLQSLFFTSDPTYWSFHGSLLVDMDAGDTCYVSIYQHQGAQQADIQGSSECNFSGFLVA